MYMNLFIIIHPSSTKHRFVYIRTQVYVHQNKKKKTKQKRKMNGKKKEIQFNKNFILPIKFQTPFLLSHIILLISSLFFPVRTISSRIYIRIY